MATIVTVLILSFPPRLNAKDNIFLRFECHLAHRGEGVRSIVSKDPFVYTLSERGSLRFYDFRDRDDWDRIEVVGNRVIVGTPVKELQPHAVLPKAGDARVLSLVGDMIATSDGDGINIYSTNEEGVPTFSRRIMLPHRRFGFLSVKEIDSTHQYWLGMESIVILEGSDQKVQLQAAKQFPGVVIVGACIVDQTMYAIAWKLNAQTNSTLMVFDVADPMAPNLVESHDLAGRANGIVSLGDEHFAISAEGFGRNAVAKQSVLSVVHLPQKHTIEAVQFMPLTSEGRTLVIIDDVAPTCIICSGDIFTVDPKRKTLTFLRHDTNADRHNSRPCPYQADLTDTRLIVPGFLDALSLKVMKFRH